MVPNKMRGEATIALKDGTKKLRFTNDACCRAEKILGGKSILGIIKGLGDGSMKSLGFVELRALVWAGMHGAGSKFSVENVGNQMLLGKTPEYIESVIGALCEAAGLKDDDDGDEDEDEDDKEEENHLDPTLEPENQDGN